MNYRLTYTIKPYIWVFFRILAFMKHFPSDIKFKYTWRGYQERVLAEMNQYLSDRALHVVAPPGSGKTVLGLEAMLRLDKPTLILAPTIAVRNQWVDRFCELFLQTGQVPEWISCDIRRPAFLTVSTYQSLHAACGVARKKKEAEEDVIALLQQQNIQTVIADEAHHLKNEWWHTLRKLHTTLSPIIVGLTATPPYDVSPAEWDRYISLNGPVDTEITVPELMREGDLCPHQDYIYFSRPSKQEMEAFNDFRRRAEALFHEIKTDAELLQAIEALPLWQMAEEHLEWIYDHMAYYSAMLIYLHAAGREVPLSFLEITGNETPHLPPFDYEWAETLLDLYLSKEKAMFVGCEEHQESLENRLLRAGIIEKGQISFLQNQKISAAFASSIEKLKSIRDIVRFEYLHSGKELRAVVLADYIRKEYLTAGPAADLESGKLGVLPIFEMLRREDLAGLRLGVLTGSVVIIPQDALPVLQEKLKSCGIPDISSSTLPYDDRYVQLSVNETTRNVLVKQVTDIFQSGHIEVLIGTKSLLGEGWDAPALNTLILASCVGSFVLSNQMRGRAIRTQRGNGQKTGNIWHLVCTDLISPTGGADMEMLQRRFRSFVGVSVMQDGGIENGVRRLGLPDNMAHWEALKQFNEKTLALAADRQGLTDRWKQGLQRGVCMIEEIKIPTESDYKQKAHRLKQLYLTRSIAFLMAGLCSGLLSFGADMLNAFFQTKFRSENDIKFFLMVAGALGVILFGRQFLHVLRLYLQYRDITKDIRGISEALLQTLVKMNVMQTPQGDLSVCVDKDCMGGIYCHLEGGTNYEKSVFTQALSEIVSVIDNPRYLILRKSKALLCLPQTDYHAVPEIVGRKKEWASYLADCWKKRVGDNELLFTRSPGGRKALLKARMKALSARFAQEVERVNKWK